MKSDLEERAENILKELDQLIMDRKVFLLHDYYSFMMTEDDIHDVEEIVEAGKNSRWKEYVEKKNRIRELEENRRKQQEFELLKLKRENTPKPVAKKKAKYKQLSKPFDYAYDEDEKKSIIEQYDKLLEEKISKLTPGSTANLMGHGLMVRTRNHLVKNNMIRKMEECVLNKSILINPT